MFYFEMVCLFLKADECVFSNFHHTKLTKILLEVFLQKCERIYVKLLSSVLKLRSFYGAFAHFQIHTVIWGSRLVEKKNLRVVVNFKEDGMLIFKS